MRHKEVIAAFVGESSEQQKNGSSEPFFVCVRYGCDV
jgi:hypothetical protein